GEIVPPIVADCALSQDAAAGEDDASSSGLKLDPDHGSVCRIGNAPLASQSPLNNRRPPSKKTFRKDEFGRDVEVAVEDKRSKKSKANSEKDKGFKKHRHKHKHSREGRRGRSRSTSPQGRLVGTPPPADPFRPQVLHALPDNLQPDGEDTQLIDHTVALWFCNRFDPALDGGDLLESECGADIALFLPRLLSWMQKTTASVVNLSSDSSDAEPRKTKCFVLSEQVACLQVFFGAANVQSYYREFQQADGLQLLLKIVALPGNRLQNQQPLISTTDRGTLLRIILRISQMNRSCKEEISRLDGELAVLRGVLASGTIKTLLTVRYSFLDASPLFRVDERLALVQETTEYETYAHLHSAFVVASQAVNTLVHSNRNLLPILVRPWHLIAQESKHKGHGNSNLTWKLESRISEDDDDVDEMETLEALRERRLRIQLQKHFAKFRSVSTVVAIGGD
ncbi:hypothetical protein BBJ28_00022439, partial [Nothophytophthora sp. Chile5]